MHQIIIDQLLKALKFQIANNNCIRLNENNLICLNVPTLCSNFEQEHYRHWMTFPKTYLILIPPNHLKPYILYISNNIKTK
jgi:hypothetical protein